MNWPRGTIGGIVCIDTEAVCISSIEVEDVPVDHTHSTSWIGFRTAGKDVCDLPRGVVGRVVCP